MNKKIMIILIAILMLPFIDAKIMFPTDNVRWTCSNATSGVPLGTVSTVDVYDGSHTQVLTDTIAINYATGKFRIQPNLSAGNNYDMDVACQLGTVNLTIPLTVIYAFATDGNVTEMLEDLDDINKTVKETNVTVQTNLDVLVSSRGTSDLTEDSNIGLDLDDTIGTLDETEVTKVGTLDTLDEDVTTLDLDGTTVGDVTADVGIKNSSLLAQELTLSAVGEDVNSTIDNQNTATINLEEINVTTQSSLDDTGTSGVQIASAQTVAVCTDVTNDVGIKNSSLLAQQSTLVDVSGDINNTPSLTWDEILSTGAHNTGQSAGKRLRQLSSIIITEGTAQGPAANGNQIQLAAGESSMDGAFDPSLIQLIGGTGSGQTRLILQYNGTTKTATVDRGWKVNPDATTEYIILSDAGREHVNEGLARAGTSTTIQLNGLASSTDDAYNNQIVFLRSGRGEDQARRIDDYVGATQTVTVDRAWDIIPNETTGYVILPNLVNNKLDYNLSNTGLDSVREVVVDNITLDHGTGLYNSSGGTATISAADIAEIANKTDYIQNLSHGNGNWTTFSGTVTATVNFTENWETNGTGYCDFNSTNVPDQFGEMICALYNRPR